MNTFRLRGVATTSLALLSGTVLVSAMASAESGYVNTFQNRYPNSMTVANVSNVGSCVICHDDGNGGDVYNAYGWELRQLMNAGANISTALAQAESFDSDVDPTGSDNLTEITASAQPGWTPGPNNTIYFDDGSTSTGQMPPTGIQGDLDPSSSGLGTSYCATAPNGASPTGSLISATGSTSVSANGGMGDLVLHAGPMEVGQPGIFYFGPLQPLSATGLPFGEGNRCVVGSTTRLAPSVADAMGNLSFALNFVGGPLQGGPVSGGFPGFMAGNVWNFQAWFRDPFCVGATSMLAGDCDDNGNATGFNLSNGLQLTFTP